MDKEKGNTPELITLLLSTFLVAPTCKWISEDAQVKLHMPKTIVYLKKWNGRLKKTVFQKINGEKIIVICTSDKYIRWFIKHGHSCSSKRTDDSKVFFDIKRYWKYFHWSKAPRTMPISKYCHTNALLFQIDTF